MTIVPQPPPRIHIYFYPQCPCLNTHALLNAWFLHTYVCMLYTHVFTLLYTVLYSTICYCARWKELNFPSYFSATKRLWKHQLSVQKQVLQPSSCESIKNLLLVYQSPFSHLTCLPLTFLPLTCLLLTSLPLTFLPLTCLPLTFLPLTCLFLTCLPITCLHLSCLPSNLSTSILARLPITV